MTPLSTADSRRGVQPPDTWKKGLKARLVSTRETSRITATTLLTTEGRRSARLLRKYRDAHAGERCFVIGNGPSLRNTDLGLLKEKQTFGLNRIYLTFDVLGFATSYLVAVNDHVLRQSGAEIAAVPCQKFLTSRSQDAVAGDSCTAFLQSREDLLFSHDPARFGVSEGATVTYVALQLAFYMGFARVVLIGVDHAFATTGPPHTLVESDGPDPNHFDPNYFGRGYQWQLPDLDASETAYLIAKRAFETAGRQIVDATVEGKLTVFPKANYEEEVRR